MLLALASAGFLGSVSLGTRGTPSRTVQLSVVTKTTSPLCRKRLTTLLWEQCLSSRCSTTDSSSWSSLIRVSTSRYLCNGFTCHNIWERHLTLQNYVHEEIQKELNSANVLFFFLTQFRIFLHFRLFPKNANHNKKLYLRVLFCMGVKLGALRYARNSDNDIFGEQGAEGNIWTQGGGWKNFIMRNFIIRSLHQYWDDQVKEDEVGGTHCMQEGN
jgi:hypothetical protein